MTPNKERIKILYVDDESRNLTAFKASFRRNYDIFTAISAAEGAQLLKENPVHIIIADQRMPADDRRRVFSVYPQNLSQCSPHPAYRLYRCKYYCRCHQQRRDIPVYQQAME